MRNTGLSVIALVCAIAGVDVSADNVGMQSAKQEINNMETLTLTQEWDKIFPKSNNVEHKKVTFVNRYGITLAADMYYPKNEIGRAHV